MATITKAGAGITVTKGANTLHFDEPIVEAAVGWLDDNRPNVIVITEGRKFVRLPLTEITLIGGVAPTGTVHDAADQILALTV